MFLAAGKKEPTDIEASADRDAGTDGLDERPASSEASSLASDAEPAAWNELIVRHDRRVVVALLARGLPLWRAQELAQEAWSMLVERQRSGRLQRLELPGLAIRQAIFLSLSETRRAEQRVTSRDEALDADPAVIDPSSDTESYAIARELFVKAQRALARCSPSAQKAFRLIYDRPELTHAEAARVLGISEQRVRQIVCDVRKRLRAALKDRTP